MRWGLVRRENTERALSNPFYWDIDTLFDDLFSSKALGSTEVFPRVDVAEDDRAIRVTAEIPGLTEKDINVTVEKNVLTISGEKKEEREEKDEKRNIVMSERRFGSFCRSMRLPEGIKAEEINAEFKNGVLTIDLPKSEQIQPRKIEVRAH